LLIIALTKFTNKNSTDLGGEKMKASGNLKLISMKYNGDLVYAAVFEANDGTTFQLAGEDIRYDDEYDREMTQLRVGDYLQLDMDNYNSAQEMRVDSIFDSVDLKGRTVHGLPDIGYSETVASWFDDGRNATLSRGW